MRRSMVVFGALAFALAAAAPAQAQGTSWLGAKLGVSVAKGSIDLTDPGATIDESNQTGFAAGVFYERDFGLPSIQLEGNYIEKGSKLSGADVPGAIDLKYVELAALLKIGLPLVIFEVQPFAGVGVDFETTCSVEGTDCADLDPALDTKSTDFNGIFGLGIKFPLGPIALYGDGRYAVGLSNISDTESVVSDLKNRAWTFQAGAAFKLGN